jgi:two-component system, sensor histidine kinase PdtaS
MRLILPLILIYVACFNYYGSLSPVSSGAGTLPARYNMTDSSEAIKLMKQAERLLDFDFQTKLHRDSAEQFLVKADLLLPKNCSAELWQTLRLLHAKSFLRNHDLENGKEIYMEEVAKYEAYGKKKEEAYLWYRFTMDISQRNIFALNISKYDNNLFQSYEAQRNLNFEKILALAKETDNKDLQGMILANQASHLGLKRQDDAEEKLIDQLVKLQPFLKTVKPYEIRYLQAELATSVKINLVNAVAFTLDAISNAKELSEKDDLSKLYGHLGLIYSILEDRKQSIAAYQTEIELTDRYHKLLNSDILNFYFIYLLQGGKLQEAQKLLARFDLKNPYYGESNVRSFEIVRASAKLNTELKHYDDALADYDRALIVAGPEVTDNIKLSLLASKGSIYVNWGKYDEARLLYENIIKNGNKKYFTSTIAAHRKLFKVDSLTGHYQAAIMHLNEANRISDSARSEEVKKNISRLNVEFQTAQKEKDIQNLNAKIKLQQLDSVSRAKDIQLLKGKVELQRFQTEARKKNILLLNAKINLQNLETADKEKNIRLLNAEVKLQRSDSTNRVRNIQVLTVTGNLQRSDLKRTTLVKNITIAGSVMLLVILGLGYRQFQITRKNKDLVEKNNEVLGYLLQDKVVLMKEIHHRVKNNLQMILSLLESQSVFLKNDALKAIQTSQNRVQAMSLIHQKLYMTENMTSITMSDYLRELIDFLEESFDSGSSIFFRLEIEEIDLDISQAVPLGLIVNEAVTNSIKYAFPDRQKGEIFVSLKKDEQDIIELIVNDNGIGLPEDLADHEVSSLGMRLIRGLANNLDGDLLISSEHGTSISLYFTNSEILRTSLY